MNSPSSAAKFVRGEEPIEAAAALWKVAPTIAMLLFVAWATANMMSHDLADHSKAGHVSGYSKFPDWADWTLHFVVPTLCTTVEWWFPKKRQPRPPIADEQTVERA